MAAIAHSNVGLMHDHMAIFNAFCDRKPLFLMSATGPMDSPAPSVDRLDSHVLQVRRASSATSSSSTCSRRRRASSTAWRANIATRTQRKVYVVLGAGPGRKLGARRRRFPMARYRSRPQRPRAGSRREKGRRNDQGREAAPAHVRPQLALAGGPGTIASATPGRSAPAWSAISRTARLSRPTIPRTASSRSTSRLRRSAKSSRKPTLSSRSNGSTSPAPSARRRAASR